MTARARLLGYEVYDWTRLAQGRLRMGDRRSRNTLDNLHEQGKCLGKEDESR